MINRVELKEAGKQLFKKAYWKCVGAAALFSVATYGVSQAIHYTGSNFGIHNAAHPSLLFALSLVLGIGAVLAYNALEVGYGNFFLKNNSLGESESPSLMELFSAFKENFANAALVIVLRDLKIALWSLCFVVPGIVKAYEYRMIPYVLAENPDVSAKEAFAMSRKMMSGHKWEAFVLDLSFLGWSLLSVLTFGLLELFYVAPYKQATNAGLYSELKAFAA